MLRRTLCDADAARFVDALDTAELLVSELVTNALVHAGTPIDFSVCVADGVRVEVADGSPHLPVIRSYDEASNTGRGLRMLEHMVDNWGAEVTRDGKVVWFQLGGPDIGHTDSAAGRQTSAQADTAGHEGLRVELLGLPLMLFAAWQQHAEALLRELLLTTMVEGSEEEAVTVHAQATDALALLAENVPRPRLTADPSSLMATVGEESAMHADVQMYVPLRSIASFRQLDEALDRAVSLADQGLFLTNGTQPEVRLMRKWICSEVRSQHDGARPSPWQLRPLPRPEPREALDWDLDRVSRSERALIGADGDNRIVAVSRQAAEILGYDRAEELVGQPLVTIVPSRYRQAHLAGFTLYFLNGRAPLLDNTVKVPALRRDHTEVAVELTVHAEQTPRGHIVFVAELR